MGLLRLLLPALLLLLRPEMAAAQDWPTRHITAIVPFGAGNSVDIVGRILTARMSDFLGQQIVVENIGGAGGTVGVARAAKAAPDGYTIVVGGTDTFAQSQSLYKTPAYNPATDFVPIVLAAEQPLVLVARKGIPANDLRELIPYMKENQAKMQFGSSGIGGATHLACAQIMRAVGVNLAHVPYRSAAAGLQDMVAGVLDLYCPVFPGALSHIESGSVKALAILTPQRSSLQPNLPTAMEQGLPDVHGAYWLGLFAPKGTPDAVMAKLASAAAQSLDTPAVQEKLRGIGTTIVPPERRTPAYLRTFVPDEVKKWAAIIQAAGLTPE